MKHAILGLLLCIAVTVSASAQSGPRELAGHREDVLRQGAGVVTADLYRGALGEVLARGASLLLEEVLETEGEVTDPSGNRARARLTLVPFVAATGERGYFVRVSVSSLEGEPLVDTEYTVYDQSSGYFALEGAPQGELQVSKSFSSDVSKVASWIRARRWSSVQSWISTQVRRGVAKALITGIVKEAFVRAGYRCPNLPWWVPGKFYIYLTTCARIAG